jgi:hypothetical protein
MKKTASILSVATALILSHLTPVNGGLHTRLNFELYVDPDMPLPSSIFSRENEKAAARMVRAIRNRVIEGHAESI